MAKFVNENLDIPGIIAERDALFLERNALLLKCRELAKSLDTLQATLERELHRTQRCVEQGIAAGLREGLRRGQFQAAETFNGIPRRCYTNLHTPLEKVIRDAVLAVEAAGAHPLLTDAVILLDEAFGKVANFVELPKDGGK